MPALQRLKAGAVSLEREALSPKVTNTAHPRRASPSAPAASAQGKAAAGASGLQSELTTALFLHYAKAAPTPDFPSFHPAGLGGDAGQDLLPQQDLLPTASMDLEAFISFATDCGVCGGLLPRGSLVACFEQACVARPRGGAGRAGAGRAGAGLTYGEWLLSLRSIAAAAFPLASIERTGGSAAMENCGVGPSKAQQLDQLRTLLGHLGRAFNRPAGGPHSGPHSGPNSGPPADSPVPPVPHRMADVLPGSLRMAI